MSTVNDDEKAKADYTLTTIIYALYAGSLLTGITGLVAIVMNYVKRGELADTMLQSHFRWQIRTFWFSLLWAAIGVATTVILIGFVILFADTIWYIYRIVKGWINLNDKKPMYAD